MATKEFLQEFEKEIADIYSQGLIKAPVHLRSGREEQLIDIFSGYNISADDYVYGYWDSHELALLKNVPREMVKSEILAGNSIALCFPDYHVYCSGIVGSLVGVACGTAWALKKQGSSARVFHFCGEMSAETGIFHEAVKYATNFDLPITFIVSDNGLSVMTKTHDTWGQHEPSYQPDMPVAYKIEDYGVYKWGKITYFKYTNGYPHSGLGQLIKF